MHQHELRNNCGSAYLIILSPHLFSEATDAYVSEVCDLPFVFSTDAHTSISTYIYCNIFLYVCPQEFEFFSLLSTCLLKVSF